MKAANQIAQQKVILAAPSNEADSLDGFLAERSDSPPCCFFRLLPESDVLVYPFSEHPKHAVPGDPVATLRLDLDTLIAGTTTSDVIQRHATSKSLELPSKETRSHRSLKGGELKSGLFLAASTLSMTSSFSWRAHSILVVAHSDAHQSYCRKWAQRELSLGNNELLCRDETGAWIYPTQMQVADDSHTSPRVYPHTVSLAVMGDVDFSILGVTPDVTNGSRLHSDGSNLFCTHCPSSFPRMSDLKEHFILEHSGLTFFCGECTRSFRSPRLVQRHRTEVHCRDVAFVCEICEKSFTSKAKLRRHLTRAHPGTFSCDTCSRSFSSQKSFEEHRLSHADDHNPLLCNDCDPPRLFSSRSHVLRHVKSIHTGKRFKCDLCDKDFSRADTLRSHTNAEHSSSVVNGSSKAQGEDGCKQRVS